MMDRYLLFVNILAFQHCLNLKKWLISKVTTNIIYRGKKKKNKNKNNNNNNKKSKTKQKQKQKTKTKKKKKKKRS